MDDWSYKLGLVFNKMESFSRYANYAKLHVYEIGLNKSFFHI